MYFCITFEGIYNFFAPNVWVYQIAYLMWPHANGPCMLTCSCALHAYVLMCHCALRAYMLTCLPCFCAHAPMCLVCLCAHMPMCLACLHAHMPTCFACLRAHVPMCLVCLGAHVSMCLACLHAHYLACLHAHVQACPRAKTSNNKNKFSITCLPCICVIVLSFFFLWNKTVVHSCIALTRWRPLRGAMTNFVQ